MEEARSTLDKQFAFHSSTEETQYFDNPTSCLRYVLDKGGACGSLVVNKPIGFIVKGRLQQVSAPQLDSTSLQLNSDLFAVDPVVAKQKSSASLGRRNKASISRLSIVQSASSSENSLENHLYHAIAIGNPEALLAVLGSPEKPANLNVCRQYPPGDGVFISPLGLAALTGSADCLEMLLDAGADINWQDGQRTGYTSLHWASIGGVKASVRCLVKKKADVSKKDNLGFTPLHYGTLQGAEIVSCLLHQAAEGVGLVQHLPTGISPLMLAALLGAADCVKLLLRHVQSNSLIQHVDVQGLSLLHYAAWSKVTKSVKAVMSHPGCVQLMGVNDQWGRSSLHHAAAAGATDVVQLLLKKGAAVSGNDKSAMKCLHWAVMSSDVTCVKFLLEHRETQHHMTSHDAAGLTVMHYAVAGSNPELISLLMSKGADVTSYDNMSFSVLLWATAFQQLDRVRELVEKGVDVQINQSDSSHVQTSQSDWAAGLQPLHVAARVGSKEMCDLFLSAGAILHCCSNYGYTALHHASCYGHVNVVEFLLSKGAEVDKLTESDGTSLHLAASHGHVHTIELLVDRGADKLLPVGQELNSPAHLAAAGGHADAVLALVRNGVPVDLLRDSDGRSLLHLAALNGHTSCCHALLQHGAPINSQDNTNDKFTPLDLSMLHDHTSCKELLMLNHAHSGGGKFHQAALRIQAAWRLHKRKERKAAAEFWAAHVILRCCKLWMMKTKAARLKRLRDKARHRAATLIQRCWRSYSAAKRRYESTYMKLKARLRQEQMAAQLILKELKEQEKSIRLPPAVPKTSSIAPISALHLLRTSQPLQPTFLDRSARAKTYPSTSQSYSKADSHKMHSSVKRELDNFKTRSQRKLDSYIHHVVSHSLPPTAQVGGAVINGPRLPLPPIPLPNTAPVTTTPPKLPNNIGNASPTQSNFKSVAMDTTQVDGPLLADSSVSVGNDEVDVSNNNNTNITAIDTEECVKRLSPVRTAKGMSPAANSPKHRVKLLKGSPKRSPTKSPKRTLLRKELPSDTLLSSSLHSSSNRSNHSNNIPSAETTDRRDRDDQLLLPTLKNRSARQSSNFDMVAALTGQKRQDDQDAVIDVHMTKLHNCAERHHKLRQVLHLLDRVHQQGVKTTTPEADPGTMDVAELRQHLHAALNEAVRLRAETDSLKTTHEKLQQVTL